MRPTPSALTAFFSVAFSIFTLVMMLSGCEQKQSVQQPTQSVAPVTPSAVRAPSMSPAATGGAWPFFVAQGDNEVADNVLGDAFMLVLDSSGSMSESACKSKSESKMDVAKRAVPAWVSTISESANLGLIVFDRHGLSERVPIGKGPENRRLILQNVAGARTGGGTPLKSSLKLAYEKITEQGRRQLGYGRYHIGIVTDGDPDTFENPKVIVDLIVAESPVAVDTIGFCIGANHALNRPGSTTYREAGDFESLRRGLTEVFAEAPTYKDLTQFGN